MAEYSKQFPKSEERHKPTTGDLLYNGVVIRSNKPFKFLQYEKKQLLSTGYYRKELFKIRYHYGS